MPRFAPLRRDAPTRPCVVTVIAATMTLLITTSCSDDSDSSSTPSKGAGGDVRSTAAVETPLFRSLATWRPKPPLVTSFRDEDSLRLDVQMPCDETPQAWIRSIVVEDENGRVIGSNDRSQPDEPKRTGPVRHEFTIPGDPAKVTVRVHGNNDEEWTREWTIR